MFEFLKKSTTGGNGLRKPWIILLGAVMGVLLLLLGGKSNPQKNEVATTPKTQQNEIVEYQEYAPLLIRRLLCHLTAYGGGENELLNRASEHL